MTTPILQLRSIAKSYQNASVSTDVLKGIDLDVESGEFVALMGPSGSGKSTLMHVISLLDRPTGGTYLLDGQDVGLLTDAERAKLRLEKIGFVFQAFHLLPRLNATENVALPLVYANVPSVERRRRAQKALEDVGLSDRAAFLPSQLSGGQKQRVAIARALVNGPSVVFADEPTGNLDPASSEQVLEILRDLSKKHGRTVVMVTHEEDAAAYSDRRIRIRDGIIVRGK